MVGTCGVFSDISSFNPIITAILKVIFFSIIAGLGGGISALLISRYFNYKNLFFSDKSWNNEGSSVKMIQAKLDWIKMEVKIALGGVLAFSFGFILSLLSGEIDKTITVSFFVAVALVFTLSKYKTSRRNYLELATKYDKIDEEKDSEE